MALTLFCWGMLRSSLASQRVRQTSIIYHSIHYHPSITYIICHIDIVSVQHLTHDVYKMCLY